MNIHPIYILRKYFRGNIHLIIHTPKCIINIIVSTLNNLIIIYYSIGVTATVKKLINPIPANMITTPTRIDTLQAEIAKLKELNKK